jgi:hypothetical protein
MSISPICDFCKKELTDFGGLVFSPPDNNETGNSQVEKLHVCKTCYQGMRSMFMKDITAEQATSFTATGESEKSTEDRKQYEEMVRAIKPGIYKHSKTGNLYRVILVGKHTETLEDLVVYEALYDSATIKNLIRPARMFGEILLINGNYVPRFAFVSDTL